MSGRVTDKRRKLGDLILREHLESIAQFWIWLYEATDDAVDRWINRPPPVPKPQIGDTRPSTTPVIKPRQHFNAHGEPKAKLDRQTAEARVAGDKSLHAYRCSLCGDWHVGHRRRHAAA